MYPGTFGAHGYLHRNRPSRSYVPTRGVMDSHVAYHPQWDEESDYVDADGHCSDQRYGRRGPSRRPAHRHRERMEPYDDHPGVRSTIEAAAERSRNHLVSSVCDELCPRFQDLEIRAGRVDAIHDALHALPEYKELRKKCSSLQKKLDKANKQLLAITGSSTSEKRVASDGRSYTQAQFAAYYGRLYWDRAAMPTECFGEVGAPMSLRVKEKKKRVLKPKWTALSDDALSQDGSVELNKRIDASMCVHDDVPRFVRAPALFDGRGPSDSESDAGSYRSSAPSITARSHSSDESEAHDEESEAHDEESEAHDEESEAQDDEDEEDEESEAQDEESEAQDEEEEEVEEIMIAGKAYYASGVTVDALSATGFTKDSNGPIYAVQPDDDVGDQVGEFIKGSPRFYDKRYALA